MSQATFDTYEYAATLAEAGVPEAQVKAFTTALRNASRDVVTREELKGRDLATRSDLAEQTARLEAKIAEARISLIKWITGLLFSFGALIIAIIFGLFMYLPQSSGLSR